MKKITQIFSAALIAQKKVGRESTVTKQSSRPKRHLLLNGFKQDMAPLVASFVDWVRARDVETLRFYLHKIRGVSWVMDVSSLNAFVQAWEGAQRHEDWAMLEQLAERLPGLYQEILQEVAGEAAREVSGPASLQG